MYFIFFNRNGSANFRTFHISEGVHFIIPINPWLDHSNLVPVTHFNKNEDTSPRIEPGLNYGWPTITYGRNYGIGTTIGEGVAKEGLEQPLLHWNPSIAPSGMAFSIGQGFPEWQNSLFVGALKAQMLVRLVFEDGQFKQKERLLQNSVGRIRDVRQGPDGAIYLLTDSTRGKLIRVTP